MVLSLHTLPVQLVYRILDNLDNKTIFISCVGVCTRLNNILNTYHPYQTLTTLHLDGNRISDQGAENLANALQQNQTLTTLELYSNGIGGEGAEHLANALQQNKTLTTLDLSLSEIHDQGAEHLANALKQNKTLTTLNLYSNGFDMDVLGRIIRSIETNKR